MKAWIADDYGPPSRLRLGELETPSVGADEVLVRMRASAVNPFDVKIVTRTVPYSPATQALLLRYLPERKAMGDQNDRLFLSLSNRNRGLPLSVYVWTKEVEGLAAGRRSITSDISLSAPGVPELPTFGTTIE
jgi:hypothetical protein